MAHKILSLFLIFQIFAFIYALTPVGKSGSKSFHIDDEEISWEEAVTICEDNNMNLASILNQQEQDTVVKFLKKEGPAGRTPLAWIAATEKGSGGKWYWYRTKAPVTFNKFHDGPPKGGNIYDTCAYMVPDGTWTATYCDAENLPSHARALCESP